MFGCFIQYPKAKALTVSILGPSSIKLTSFSSASKHAEWRQAMNEEFTALMQNGTWNLVPPRPNMNLVGFKWVFQIKRRADGSIERYKAHLVANKELIMGRPIVLLLNPLPFGWYCLLPFLQIGSFVNLTSRILFFMELLKKMFLWLNSRALFTHFSLIRFAIYRRHFMALNKFLRLGFTTEHSTVGIWISGL